MEKRRGFRPFSDDEDLRRAKPKNFFIATDRHLTHYGISFSDDTNIDIKFLEYESFCD